MSNPTAIPVVTEHPVAVMGDVAAKIGVQGPGDPALQFVYCDLKIGDDILASLVSGSPETIRSFARRLAMASSALEREANELAERRGKQPACDECGTKHAGIGREHPWAQPTAAEVAA